MDSPITVSSRAARSLKDSLQLPSMTAEELLGFRQMQFVFRGPLLVPTYLLAVVAMTSFLIWDLARENGWGPGATTRVAGAGAVLCLLWLLRVVWQPTLRIQALSLYSAIYAWQLAEGQTMEPDTLMQFPGLLVIMFASIFALMHASDAWINLVLAGASLPFVLPHDATLAQWLYVVGLFCAVILLVWVSCAQRERTAAVIFLSKAQWKRDAQTDLVTTLPNRRTFEAAMQRESWRLDANPSSLILAVIDIDHFKRVNDQYGHDAGDDVLREVALRLRSQVRDVDILARLGGEEFALILLDMKNDTASDLLARLKDAIEVEPFAVEGQAMRCTVSVGVTTGSKKDGDWHSLFQRADRAMYEAKAKGRNQVCFVFP